MKEIAMCVHYAPPYLGNVADFFNMPKNDISERRAHERFDIVVQSDMILPPHCPGLGKILDISRGGLSFVNEYNCRAKNGFTYIDIYFENNICCLKNVPCSILHDGGNSLDGKEKNNIGRVKFEGLSTKQKIQLEYLIKMNTLPKCHRA